MLLNVSGPFCLLQYQLRSSPLTKESRSKWSLSCKKASWMPGIGFLAEGAERAAGTLRGGQRVWRRRSEGRRRLVQHGVSESRMLAQASASRYPVRTIRSIFPLAQALTLDARAPWVGELLSLAVEGFRTNFWILRCPAYCMQPRNQLVRVGDVRPR